MSELSIDLDDFNKPKVLDNYYEILANRLLTLLISSPGNFPNNPDMGVGIKNYMYEFSSGATIAELQSRIIDQVNTYIGREINLLDVLIQYVADPNRPNDLQRTLVVGFRLQTSASDSKIISIALKRNTEAGDRILSDFIIA
jgi:hypothetical protein